MAFFIQPFRPGTSVAPNLTWILNCCPKMSTCPLSPLVSFLPLSEFPTPLLKPPGHWLSYCHSNITSLFLSVEEELPGSCFVTVCELACALSPCQPPFLPSQSSNVPLL